MQTLLLSFCVLLFYACGNSSVAANEEKDTALSSQTIHTNVQDTVITSAQPIALNGCYQMILKQDTATMQLTVKDSTVTGELQYDRHEKDRNTGTLQGVLRNDVIVADYTFQSEGTTSVREVVFKIQDRALLEGFGAVTEQNGKTVFQNKDGLQFQTATPFRKIACLWSKLFQNPIATFAGHTPLYQSY